MPSVLLIEPFYGGSHKELMDTIIQNCSDIVLFSLPAKKWHWRARTSALYFAEIIPQDSKYRVMFSSCVLNLVELSALRPDLASLKRILYFHENQLVYPVQKDQKRDYQYGYNQILSCLVADRVVFNSHYNMSSFLENVDTFIRRTPDRFSFRLAERIREKSCVIYIPMDYSIIDQLSLKHKDEPSEISSPSPGLMNKCSCEDCKRPLHVVWPHRWEHDKGPDDFFSVMISLQSLGLKFQLSVLGECYAEVPDAFNLAKESLEPFIRHWGFCERKEDYYKILIAADVCVSTAFHEFFGVAMMESVYAGCYPLCPKRLVYEELYPDECLYNTTNQLRKKLKDFCEKPHLVRRRKVEIDCSKYTWDVQGKELQSLFS